MVIMQANTAVVMKKYTGLGHDEILSYYKASWNRYVSVSIPLMYTIIFSYIQFADT